MNFIEIFRKYDKVVESFIGKTKSKTVKGIIDDADRYVSKDKEILRQLKEFVKQDGYEEDYGFKEDLPGQFYIEHQNDEGEFEEWVIIELNLVTSVEDGMYSYSVVSLGEKDSYVEAVVVPEDYSDYDNIRWEELDVDTRNQILDYLNFTDLRYDQINESFTKKIKSSRKKNTLKESFTKKIKKQSSKNVIDNADEDIKMKSPLTFEDDEVSDIFFNELVDVDDYEDNVYTLEDASIDSHEHDGYSEYFPFDDYQSNSWKDNNKIVKFNELRFFTGLKKLPEYAFVNCTSLEELILPDNLEQIEQGAFANCISLKTVKMPKNHTLKFIEDSAFANTGLVSVVIPDGVKVIGECAFADCEYLESVVIPPSVKKIERGAFSRCRKLKSVSGIETVSEFGTDVFYGCGLLERLDSDVFGKFLIPRRFDKTLFSADWINDSNTVEERFLETYCLNHYDTEDYKHITEKEWEEDEFNPNSPNFDENRFNECAWNYANDDVSWDWDNFKQLIINKFQGRGGWVCPEDGERFSDFSSAFEYCIPDNCDWGELEVKQDGGSLIVCGTEIVPLCDRYIDDEIDEIYPNEFIDYESLRFCDPIEKEISL